MTELNAIEILTLILAAITLLASVLYFLSIRYLMKNITDQEKKRDLKISSSFYFGILLFSLGELFSIDPDMKPTIGALLKTLALMVFLLALIMRFKTNFSRFKIYLKQ
ncbi:MAG: hypothetical protein ABH803_02110 [Candidatus Micrarchaeota archaeon]